MRILAFCPAALRAEHEVELLRSEHAYRAVFDAFLPLLASLGELCVVRDPAREVDALFAEARARGEDCLLFCFAAPHEVPPQEWACPAVSVLIGPFDELEEGQGPRHSLAPWRRVLSSHGRALALSPAALDVVRRVMGESFPVRAIAPPLFERFGAGAAARGEPPQGARRVRVHGRILDSADYEHGPESARFRLAPEQFCTRPWSGAREQLPLDWDGELTAGLGGFYEPEYWGVWSRISEPWIMLPFPVSGSVKLTLCAAGFGRNAGRTIAVELGGVRRELTLEGGFAEPCLSFELAKAAHLIQFRGLDTRELAGTIDHRSLGIGLRWIALEGSPSDPAPPLAPAVPERCLSGVLYTTLDADLPDDTDPLQRWRDVIKAFCFALRGAPDAALVLHAARHPTSLWAELQGMLHRIGPMSCRLVLLDGQLDAAQLRELIDASTYYVNASWAEALCVPFKRFLSAGVPALAPSHMWAAESLTPECGYVMRYVALSPGWLAQHARPPLRARRFRPDWESLVEAFASSYRAAIGERAAYARMSGAVLDAQARSAGDAVVRASLESFLRSFRSAS